MTDLDLRAMSVRCPLCSATSQQPCQDERGNKNPVPHLARAKFYLRVRTEYQRGFVNPQDVTPTSQYNVTGINPQGGK